MLDVEVLDLVSFLVFGNHVQEFSQAVLFQVFLSQVFQVSLGKWHSAVDANLGSVLGNFDLISQLASFAINFYSLSQVLSEVGCDENLILHRLGAIDREAEGLVFLLILRYWLSLLHDSGDK